MQRKPIRVVVTGAAGHIAYSLLFRIASGEMFGEDQPVILQLLELPGMMTALEGVAMELNDCAYPLLEAIILSDQVEEVMKDVNWALLLGAKPRRAGMERSDLIRDNGPIFVDIGKTLNKHAAADVRILTVGNPCNSNCLIALCNAPDIPQNRFHAMTRLDQNRAQAILAQKTGVALERIMHMIIWGNHSATQVPDYHNARIDALPATEVINDMNYLRNTFISKVAQRGAAIIQARGHSSAASAAAAVINSVRSLNGEEEGIFSSAVISDGNPYGIPDKLVFSFPCRYKAIGEYEIEPDLRWDNYLATKIQDSTQELLAERELISDLLPS